MERVRYVIESEINPQLASHGGRVSLREVTAKASSCCNLAAAATAAAMVDATLRGGVEKTLKERVREVTVSLMRPITAAARIPI